MKKLLFIWLLSISVSIFAVVPTSDVYIMGQDVSTAGAYAGQIPAYLTRMNSAMNAAQQVSQLKGLIALQSGGTQLCELCNATDLAAVLNYQSQVNSDLCSQFSQAMANITGSQNAIASLQEVMAAFAANPKAAGLALQQASVATLSATQNTLAQIQVLQAQAQQKILADEKVAQTQQGSMQNSMAAGGW